MATLSHITMRPTAQQVRDARKFATNPGRYTDLPQTCFNELRENSWAVLKADHLRRLRVQRKPAPASIQPGDLA